MYTLECVEEHVLTVSLFGNDVDINMFIVSLFGMCRRTVFIVSLVWNVKLK